MYFGKVAYVKNIVTTGVSDHQDYFEPTQGVGTRPRQAIKVGTNTTKKMFHVVIKFLKDHYPKLEKITGDRTTGARAGKNSPPVELLL